MARDADVAGAWLMRTFVIGVIAQALPAGNHLTANSRFGAASDEIDPNPATVRTILCLRVLGTVRAINTLPSAIPIPIHATANRLDIRPYRIEYLFRRLPIDEDRQHALCGCWRRAIRHTAGMNFVNGALERRRG
jgi:hypothetical protein